MSADASFSISSAAAASPRHTSCDLARTRDEPYDGIDGDGKMATGGPLHLVELPAARQGEMRFAE